MLLLASVHFANKSYDDVFISLRYAENLAAGRGLVFNPGERVEGYSNFAWTVLLAVPAWLGAAKHEVGMFVVAKLLGVASGIATLWLTTLAGATPPAMSRAAAWPLGACYLALLAPFGAWIGAGLETGLVALWLTAFVVLDERERAAGFRGAPWSFLVLCLAALTRPEPVLMAPVLLGLRVVEVTPPLRLAAGARAALLFGVPYAAFLAFRWGYYGELVPNTYYAKRADDPEAWERGWDYVAAAVAEMSSGWVLATACLVSWWGRGWSRSSGVVLVMLSVHVASVVFDGGDWMTGHRLLVPALPLLAVLLQRAWGSAFRVSWEGARPRAIPAWVMPPPWAHRLNEWVARARRQPVLGRDSTWVTASAVLLLAVAAASSFGSYRPWFGVAGSGFRGIELTRGGNFAVAFWLREHLDRPGLLATGEAGVIPYYTKLPLLDLFGLMDRRIARMSGVRHRKFDVSYALGRRPRYVVLPVYRSSDGTVRGAMAYAHALLHDARFTRDYALMNELGGAQVFRRVAP